MPEFSNPGLTGFCSYCRVEVHRITSVCLRCHAPLPAYETYNLFDLNKTWRGDQLPGQTKFINYDLTKADKADVSAHIQQEGWIEQSIEAVLKGNFRIVISFDTKQECFLAFIFPQGESGAYSGYSISARGSTSTKALAVVLWKHVVLYDGSWPKDDGGRRYPVDL
jgi:hypothetical protein